VKRRLTYAWLTLSGLWITYAVSHALLYLNRWGAFIDEESRATVLFTTAYEIAVPPTIFGVLLLILTRPLSLLRRILGHR
jgi:hypothetical protein